MINIIGLGYIGFPTALMMASHGVEVIGADHNKELIAALNAGKTPFEEKGLDELFGTALQSGIKFTTEYQVTDTYIISAPTSYDKSNENDAASYVSVVVKDVMKVCPKGATVVIESTAAPGTIDKFVRPVIEANGFKIGEDINLVHAPEQITPGNMVYELLHNNRTIGADSSEIGEKIKKVYASFCQGEIVVTDIRTAEMTKVVENTICTDNTAFANDPGKSAMIRIGILTFHRSINYGAFMQSYSLMSKIKDHFPNSKVEIIDYTSPVIEELYKPRINLITFKHPVISKLKREQYKKFRLALKNLPLSEKIIISNDTNGVLQSIENDYDIFVVGSDAVWNWIKRGFPNPYLLNFKSPVKKMSYAASAFGMLPSYVGEKETAYFKESLKGFSFIGVRDNYTMDLVKKVCPEQNPVFTCDPTVFLNLENVYTILGKSKAEFKDYIYTKYNLPSNKKLIGVMGTTEAVVTKIKNKYRDTHTIVSLYKYVKGADKYLLNLSPFEWTVIFSLFDITLTTFFHGTLLSLKNNTPVITMDRSEFSQKSEGKIADLMKRMNLQECHFIGKNPSDNMLEQMAQVFGSYSKYKERIADNLSILETSSHAFFRSLEELIG